MTKKPWLSPKSDQKYYKMQQDFLSRLEGQPNLSRLGETVREPLKKEKSCFYDDESLVYDELVKITCVFSESIEPKSLSLLILHLVHALDTVVTEGAMIQDPRLFF